MDGLYPKSNVDRFYVPHKQGGTGLIFIEDLDLELANRGLEVHINSSDESLIQVARCDTIHGFEANSILKTQKKE